MHENLLIVWKIYFYRLVLGIEFSGSFSRLIFYFFAFMFVMDYFARVHHCLSVRSLLPPDFLLAFSLWIMQRWASGCSVWNSISFMNLVHRGIEVCHWGNMLVIFMFSTLSPLSGILTTQDSGKLPPTIGYVPFLVSLSSHFSLRSSY